MKAASARFLLATLTISGIGTAQSASNAQAPDFDTPKTIAGTPLQDAEPPKIAASGKHVFLLWHEFPTTGSAQPDVFLSRSNNGGGSFSSRINLSNSEALDSRDEDIAVSGKNVFVAWSENVDEVLFRRSTNNGGSFDSVKKLSAAAGAVHPRVAVSGSDVYVTWEAIGLGGNTDIFLAKSEDNGRNFSTEVNLSSNDGPSEFPQLAVSDDRAVVTWRDASTPGLDFEIFVTRED